MDKKHTNVVFCVLNLREASDCIKDEYPNLSLTLLQLAQKLIDDLNISSDEIDAGSVLVDSISR